MVKNKVAETKGEDLSRLINKLERLRAVLQPYGFQRTMTCFGYQQCVNVSLLVARFWHTRPAPTQEAL
jgi:hypothetical protein